MPGRCSPTADPLRGPSGMTLSPPSPASSTAQRRSLPTRWTSNTRLRSDRFAKEFNLKLILRSSGHEYRRLDAIVGTQRPVIVPLDFPKPPEVATPEAALDVSLERLMHWDLAPENPGRLATAGVTILLTGHGLEKRSDFWPALRKAIRRGLDQNAALTALTVAPANAFGLKRYGTIEPGKAASFVLTKGDPFTSDEAKFLETWVDGERYEIEAEKPTRPSRHVEARRRRQHRFVAHPHRRTRQAQRFVPPR